MNEAARRVVAQAARTQAAAMAATVEQLGSVTDAEIRQAFDLACAEHPELCEWSGAADYFGSVFLAQFERNLGGSKRGGARYSTRPDAKPRGFPPSQATIRADRPVLVTTSGAPAGRGAVQIERDGSLRIVVITTDSGTIRIAVEA